MFLHQRIDARIVRFRKALGVLHEVGSRMGFQRRKQKARRKGALAKIDLPTGSDGKPRV